VTFEVEPVKEKALLDDVIGVLPKLKLGAVTPPKLNPD
jgi:hypothetical protein